MEEFEKWWKADPEVKTIGRIGFSRRNCAEKAWKAALDWVLKEITLSPIGLKAIQKELGK